MTIELILPKKTVAGADALDSVPALAAGLGKNVLLMTARSFQRGPLHASLVEGLRAAGLKVALLDPISGEPPVEMIDRCADEARRTNTDVVVGVGGGSTLDAAKAVALLVRNAGSIEGYQLGTAQAVNDAVPFIAAPTTAGTGSEGNAISVVTNLPRGIKKAIRHASIVPAAAVLDPRLTATLPPETTAATAMDALSHAIESLVSTRANDLTQGYSLQALRLIGRSVRKAVHQGDDLDARQQMLIASYCAGISLNGGVGAMHLLAQPVSVVTGFPHSRSITALMPAVVHYNVPACPELYALAAQALGGTDIVAALKALMADIGLADPTQGRRLSDEETDQVMESVRESTGHIYAMNPRPIDEKQARELLLSALGRGNE